MTGERDARCAELEATLHREVPLSGHMGVAVEAYDGASLRLSADFERNINIHGTAFGGSLYSACALCGWGLLHLKFGELGLAAHIVLSAGGIRYLRPVKRHIEVRCSLPEDYPGFNERLQERGKARLTLRAEVLAGGAPAVIFDGEYAGILKHP